VTAPNRITFFIGTGQVRPSAFNEDIDRNASSGVNGCRVSTLRPAEDRAELTVEAGSGFGGFAVCLASSPFFEVVTNRHTKSPAARPWPMGHSQAVRRKFA
jgi:hypothetical protein